MDEKMIAHLLQIYNTLCLVETKGENTKIMGRCLEALDVFILDCKKNKEE